MKSILDNTWAAINLQVRKADPVPADEVAATWRAGTGSAFLTCKFESGVAS